MKSSISFAGDPMQHDLDDHPLLPQVPRPTEKESLPPARELTPADAKNFEPRPGDTDEGEARLPQAPPYLSVPSEKDVIRDETPLEEELRRADELMANEPGILGWTSLLGHPLIGAIFLGSAGLLGLFAFNQIVASIHAINSLAPPLYYVGWGIFALLASAILYSVIRFAGLYIRLRRNRQLRLQGLVELQKRTQLRWLINAKRHEAYQQLEAYLREYPTEITKTRKRLALIGLKAEQIQELSTVREKLLDRDRWSDSDVWLSSFRDTFQSKLDDIASERIKYWARRAAFTTAASPNHLVDTSLTLYFSFALLSDLCTIYNLRTGKLGTMVLLSKVFFNSYLAGQMSDMEGWTTDQIQQLVEPHLPATEIVLGRVFSKLGAKASAGAINYLLLARLGKYACRMLRPVTKA